MCVEEVVGDLGVEACKEVSEAFYTPRWASCGHKVACNVGVQMVVACRA